MFQKCEINFAQVLSHEQAEAAGKLISAAYQLSDEADLAYKAGDSEKEKQFYHQVNDKLREALHFQQALINLLLLPLIYHF